MNLEDTRNPCETVMGKCYCYWSCWQGFSRITDLHMKTIIHVYQHKTDEEFYGTFRFGFGTIYVQYLGISMKQYISHLFYTL